MPDYPVSITGAVVIPDPQPATAAAIGALVAQVQALEARIAALEGSGAVAPAPPTSGSATFSNLTVTGKLILKTTASDPYTELQWQDSAGKVIAQIVAHLDVHSGRSAPDGGHLSLYVRDVTIPEGRRGLLDIDTATSQNGGHPAIRIERASPYLRDGSAIYEQFSDGDHRLDKRADGTAVWTKAAPPKYP
jgi:hypothetical protein